MSKKCWKSPSDDNLHREEVMRIDSGEEYFTTTITPPPSPEEKRRNLFGIDILPDIPEETEESDEENEDSYNVNQTDTSMNKRRFSAAIKRLSTIGDNFDEYISKQVRRDSESERESSENKEFSEIEVTYNNISPITDIQREKIMKSLVSAVNSLTLA